MSQPQGVDGSRLNIYNDGDAYDEHVWAWRRANTKTCTLVVKYSANGYNGEEAQNPPPSTTRAYSVFMWNKATGKPEPRAVTVTSYASDPGDMENPGYVFVGWATSATTQKVSYNVGSKISHSWSASAQGTYTLTLYAVWTNRNVITYHPDAHTEESGNVYQVKESGETAILYDDTFSRIGYSLSGWATEEDGSKVYDIGGGYSSDEPLDLYPFWTPKNYTITYMANNGTGDMPVQTITYDSPYEVSDCLFTKEGYVFANWNDSADGKGQRWILDKEYVCDTVDDLILYAIWKGDEYTVSYDANANSVSGSMPSSIAVFGSPFITRRNQFSRFGLTFTGWNTEPDGSGESWIPSEKAMDTYKRTEDSIWNLADDVTLYAQWDASIYPFGTCFFNGKNAKDFGIVVEELPSYIYAERAFNHKQVNGRNGDVILDSERYENVKKIYKVACYDSNRSFYESAVALSTWLHSAGNDYIRLEDSYEPGSYRMAIYEESNEIANIMGKAGKCEITFNCKPQRFLLTGEDEIKVESSGSTIYNPTVYNARPLLRILGTGTVTINGKEIEIYENFNDILIDCETCNARNLASEDMNYAIRCDDFPVLKPGFNTIVYDEEIESIHITPRWWIL